MTMVTQDQATAYFASRLNSDAWTEQPTQQVAALAQAHSIVNRLPFQGEKTVDTQEDMFPRYGATTVPQKVQDAICEIALALLDGVDPEMEAASLALTKQSMASAHTTFDHSADMERLMAGVPSATAWRLLQPFMPLLNTVKLVRG